jgi:heme-degrading monooxygenase HmoA
MYIAVTKVTAPRQALERMAEAFRKAAPDMKNFPGCTGLELWLSDDTLEAVSRWESKEAVDAYAKSPMFGAHHPGAESGRGAGGGAVTYYEGEVLF